MVEHNRISASFGTFYQVATSFPSISSRTRRPPPARRASRSRFRAPLLLPGWLTLAPRPHLSPPPPPPHPPPAPAFVTGTKPRTCSKCFLPCKGHLGPYGPSCIAPPAAESLRAADLAEEPRRPRAAEPSSSPVKSPDEERDCGCFPENCFILPQTDGSCLNSGLTSYCPTCGSRDAMQ
jgi:hypothetical protein